MALIKAILWDFGNVICWFSHQRACAALARRGDPWFNAERVYDAVFASGLERRFDAGEITPAAFLDELRRRCGVTGTDEEIADDWSAIFEINPAVDDVMRRIPDGVRLVLASNCNALHHRWFRRQYADLLDLFDAEVLSFRVGAVKPTERFYRACLAAAGVSAGECLYFDDRPDLVVAAARLGIDAVVYHPGLNVTEVLAGRGVVLRAAAAREPSPSARRYAAEPPWCVGPRAVVTASDFGTSGTRTLAFGLDGNVLASVVVPTAVREGPGGARELDTFQIEGQARAAVRAVAAALREAGRLSDWVAHGISATHHTAARVDRHGGQVRPAILWNDGTLAAYHARGLDRLGGQAAVEGLIGTTWATRYSLSHLVKDEAHLSREDWDRTYRILPHGALAAAYLTGNFDAVSVSSAASTGLMDLRTRRWRRGMLAALLDPAHRDLAWRQLPGIVSHGEPVGPLALGLAWEVGLDPVRRPLVFAASDDQQAGLVGSGAGSPGELAVVFGSSIVVSAAATDLPAGADLDVMALSWSGYLLMRCHGNGGPVLNRIVGADPGWPAARWADLDAAARGHPPGAGGVGVLPFADAEPAVGVGAGCAGIRWYDNGAPTDGVAWLPDGPDRPGQRCRATFEAFAFLVRLGVEAHERAGRRITRVALSGGMARSPLLAEILAAVINRPLARTASEEGPALGAAVVAAAEVEQYHRRARGVAAPFTVADAAARMVAFRDPVAPNAEWVETYGALFAVFRRHLHRLTGG